MNFMKSICLLIFVLMVSPLQLRAQQPVAPVASPTPVVEAPPAAKADPAKPQENPPPKTYDPQKQCVDGGDFVAELKSGRNPVGDTIVIDTNFLPANQAVNVGIRTPYVDRLRFFAALELADGSIDILNRQDVITRRAVATDSLVTKKLLEADQSIVTLTIDDADAGSWQKATLYLYTCGTLGSPARVSKTNVRLSPYWQSIWICAAAILLAYVAAGFAMRRRDHSLRSFMRSLDPVKLTAGPDGKGSLSKFQVLCFSLVVFGLILLFMLQTGKLSDLSSTILALLGISGLGATVAKGADAQRTTLSAENKAWLLRKGWLPSAQKEIDPSTAIWRDFFTTDNEFDVYRYQSFIFGLVVVVALIAAGVTQLATFTIPDTILGIVGLSQAVYIGGKLVTPTNITDVNAALTDLRDQEKKLRDAAGAKKQGRIADLPEAAGLVGQQPIDAYREKARDAAALFTAATAHPVPDSGLDPSFG
jgi:hypothetical protein